MNPATVRVHPCFSFILLLSLAWILATTVAQAEPPNLIHYQGRLTDNTGKAITTTRQLFFSLYQDPSNSPNVPNAGTLLYRETQTLTPDSNGVFSVFIGQGTVEAGDFNDPQAFFNTGDPVFLQISVGSINTVLLPRVRLSTVPYAFVAENAVGAITPQSVSIQGVGLVIDSSGNWVGPGSVPGTPVVADVVDVTGGVIVVGDLLRISGSSLDQAAVTIGGRPARIKSQSSTEIVCQVPTGLAMGLQPVALVESNAGIASRTVAHIDLHRLLVVISPGDSTDYIAVIDAKTNQILAQLSATIAFSSVPLQIGFGHDGALCLVPNNSSSTVYAIDLTANPPRIADQINLSGITVARGVDISPAHDEFVVCDSGGNNLRMVPLNETFPPYSSGLMVGAGSNVPSLASGFGPRACKYLGEDTLLALGQGLGQLRTFTRDLVIGEFRNPDVPSGFTNFLNTGINPSSMVLTADKTRVLVVTDAQSNLSAFDVATFWPIGAGSGVNESAGPEALKMAISPNGRTILVADRQDDLLRSVSLDGLDLNTVGVIEGPDGVEDFQIAAIEPVTGEHAAVGTDASTVWLFELIGNVLRAVAVLDLNDDDHESIEIGYQP